jgi:ribosomal 50S subunit-recycling heat shock protein
VGGDQVRLDKYLKVSRLIKRRTIANEACDSGRVEVNGRVVKASYDVKEGDIIQITLGERQIRIQVLDVKEHVLKNDAALLYKQL